jgi:hypothetical protein
MVGRNHKTEARMTREEFIAIYVKELKGLTSQWKLRQKAEQAWDKGPWDDMPADVLRKIIRSSITETEKAA